MSARPAKQEAHWKDNTKKDEKKKKEKKKKEKRKEIRKKEKKLWSFDGE